MEHLLEHNSPFLIYGVHFCLTLVLQVSFILKFWICLIYMNLLASTRLDANLRMCNKSHWFHMNVSLTMASLVTLAFQQESLSNQNFLSLISSKNIIILVK
jgi:hypothetical protein